MVHDMRSFLIFFIFLSCKITQAQTTTTAMKWKSPTGIECIYSGQLKNGKPDGKGVAKGLDGETIFFGEFSNGNLEGTGIAKYYDKSIVLGHNWKNGYPAGLMGMFIPFRTLRLGNMDRNGFNGICYEIDDHYNLGICEMKNSQYEGRAIKVLEDGDLLTDTRYINDIENGPGLKYYLNRDELVKGIYKHSQWDNYFTGDYPSFMNNHLRKAVTDKHKTIYTRVDNEGRLIDTGYAESKTSGWTEFGLFSQGSLISGIEFVKDGIEIIGQFDAETKEKNGICLEFIPFKHLKFGYFKQGSLQGKGIEVQLGIAPIWNFGNFPYVSNDENNSSTWLYFTRISTGKCANINDPGCLDIPIGTLENASVKKNVNASPGAPQQNEFHPKDVCTAINYLIRSFTDGFKDINSNEAFNPDGSSDIDPFVSENRTKDYKSLFYFPGAKVNKIYDAYKEQGFYFGIAISDEYAVIKKKYDDLCRQLTACNITSLQKHVPMKLSGTVAPAKPGEGAFTTLYIPTYPGRTRTPKIVIIMEKADKWQLTARIISYQDIE